MCFMLRRICFASIIVYLPRQSFAQAQLICFMMSLQLMFIAYTKPYIEPWMNRLEISNELLVLQNSYFLFMYSQGMILKKNPIYPRIPEMVKDEETQYKAGWAQVGLLGAMILLNLVVILYV